MELEYVVIDTMEKFLLISFEKVKFVAGTSFWNGVTSL